jgi:hypothetical protein
VRHHRTLKIAKRPSKRRRTDRLRHPGMMILCNGTHTRAARCRNFCRPDCVPEGLPAGRHTRAIGTGHRFDRNSRRRRVAARNPKKKRNPETIAAISRERFSPFQYSVVLSWLLAPPPKTRPLPAAVLFLARTAALFQLQTLTKWLRTCGPGSSRCPPARR